MYATIGGNYYEEMHLVTTSTNFQFDQGRTQVLAKGKQFLPLINHPQCSIAVSNSIVSDISNMYLLHLHKDKDHQNREELYTGRRRHDMSMHPDQSESSE